MKYVKGDLLEALDKECSYIAHACNAQGVMGSGVAKQIKKKWPFTFTEYYDHVIESDGEQVLGDCIVSQDGVCNLIAQKYYGRDKRHLHYGHLANCLQSLCVQCESLFGDIYIGVPYKMGCDRAGGDWEVVKELLEGCEALYDIEFIVYDWRQGV